MKIYILGKGRECIFYFLIIFLPATVNAHITTHPLLFAVVQQETQGIITDATGPLPGVSVSIKGTTTTALTNTEGRFAIHAAPGDVLLVQLLGYGRIEITITGYDLGTIVLEPEATSLEEVVVNAGYYSVSQKQSTGSISRVTAKEIEKQPVTNVLGALQGRMAGVDIVQNTGVAGGGFNIQIRGVNSLRPEGNAPLYIIDGVPYASQSMGDSNTSNIIQGSLSPLNSINPSDIASIEVLKDADATAIYGSRGANGVVLITTKKGHAGKTEFNLGVSSGFAGVSHFIDMMDTSQYLAMRAAAFANDGVTPYPAAAYDINGIWDQERYTDWQKELIGGTATYNDLTASASGGSGQTQFLASASYHNETTVFPGDFKYRKGNFRASVNHTSQDQKFTLGFSAGYTAQQNNQPGTDFTRTSLLLAPNAPALYNPDGTLNWEGSTWTNPLSNLESKYIATTQDLISNMTLSYNIVQGLSLKTSFGFSDTRTRETKTLPSTMYDPAWEATSEFSTLYLNNARRSSWIIEPQLNWTQSLGSGTLNVLLGSTSQKQADSQLVHMAEGFTSNALIYNLSAATLLFALRDTETVYKYNAGFARVNYNWKEKYFINLTGRRDASSRFGPERRTANFGAIGAAWIFSQEALLMDNVHFLSFGKLRASYGSSGNDQIGDYQYLNTYGIGSSNYSGVVGLNPTRLYNPDFGWEKNTKFEAALELGFLNHRIFATASWFRNRSSSQLVGIPLPATTGFSALQANLDATVENSGLELTLRAVNIDTASLRWVSSINLTAANNKLIEFSGLEASTYASQYVIGQPLNIVRLYKYTGIDPTTGLYTVEDVNGDGAITPTEDRQTIRNLNPRFFGGLQNQLTYHNWQLDFLLQFVKKDAYKAETQLGAPGSFSNQPAAMARSWQSPGDTAPYQLFTAGYSGPAATAYSNYMISDGAITDASFIRLKNISVSYKIPEKWLSGLQCTATLRAQNLLTITPYKGADPEFAIIGYLPPLRTITGGLQFTF
ncbi:SusC/RagA family TonB-linked outer membrane protein [Flavobacterium psychrotrophum]|uniref:SusC/RagA family TonB-linked outer membrane protein n=1 Tax=Flavobacterium psychrotrophum TaxID=2294119 RepID=UPI000E30F085|nr:SusC/RagA family TonB-linked outer membrane protein [Flavobacterium psychrotrophum]